MPRRSRSQSPARPDMPPTLRLLVNAAKAECPSGHAEALADLTVLACRKVPSRGIFDPGSRDEPELFAAIESVARAHLNLGHARSAWHAALDTSGLPFDRRDAIETTAVQVQTVSDTAYFYAGLAFGLTFASLGRV